MKKRKVEVKKLGKKLIGRRQDNSFCELTFVVPPFSQAAIKGVFWFNSNCCFSKTAGGL